MPLDIAQLLSRKVKTVLQANDMVQQGDLRNPIHPLFHPDRFPPSIDYPRLAPSLRLVTRMLTTPQIQQYFFTVFFGTNELALARDATGQQFEACYSGREIGALSIHDTVGVNAKLLEMSRKARFDVLEQTSYGYCEPVAPAAGDSHSSPGDFLPLTGLKSIIALASIWYEAIRPSPEKDLLVLMNDRFSVAITLLRELGHAANFAVMGDRQEDFFEDCAVAEAGLSIEAALLGGVTSTVPGRPTSLYQWTNTRTLSAYARNNVPLRDIVRELKYSCEMPSWSVLTYQHECFWERADRLGPTMFALPEMIDLLVETAFTIQPAPLAPRAVEAVVSNAAFVDPDPPRGSGLQPTKALRLRQTYAARLETLTREANKRSEASREREFWERFDAQERENRRLWLEARERHESVTRRRRGWNEVRRGCLRY